MLRIAFLWPWFNSVADIKSVNGAAATYFGNGKDWLNHFCWNMFESQLQRDLGLSCICNCINGFGNTS